MNEQETHDYLKKNGIRSQDINRGHGTIIVTVWFAGRNRTPEAVRNTLASEGFKDGGGIPGTMENWSKIFTMPSTEEMMSW